MTVPAMSESLPSVNRSKFVERKALRGRLQKSKSPCLGVQVSRCMHSKVSEEDALPGASTAPWRGDSGACPAEREYGRGGTPAVGSCPCADLNSSQVHGFPGWVHQREECNLHSPQPSGSSVEFQGTALWARGYWVSTVGKDEEAVRKYIRDQEKEDRRLEQLNIFR